MLVIPAEGDSEDESSDSDGGPGFFDGINDNPSEEAFAAAAAKGRAGRLARGNGAGAAGGFEEGVEELGVGSRKGGAAAAAAGGKTEAAAAAAISGAGEGGSCSDEGRGAVPPEGCRGGSDGDSDAENNDGSRNVNGAGGGGGGEAPTVGKKRSGRKEGGEEEAPDGKKAPSNFSKVDPSLPRAELAERFPLFLEAESCTVEVEAGQMLFLPAGWFHEVRGVIAVCS